VKLREDDIRHQLDWLKQNGFGGVELAFTYPLPGQPRGPDWLSPAWSEKVALAKRVCDSIGLGCDFTWGTLWPFGGTFVEEQDSSQTLAGASPQRLGRSWELPLEGRILNHLDSRALARYSERMGSALADALKGSRSALFCDSWEVEPEGLWTGGFGVAFRDRFGYDVREFMPMLDQHPDVRYDHRKLIAEYVLDGFYRPFTEISHQLRSFTRVQCHGAPTDLLAAYAAVDVPESEAILFDPEFARIPASAAALADKPVISAEAFTCLYGWNPYPGPGPHQGEEQVADLKLVADALFANGVNHIFWHGMPYQAQASSSEPQASSGNRFYATAHVGPDSGFAAELPAFNAYMAKVCSAMKQGRPYTDVAVYLPIEDQWMKGELPPDLQKPSAKYHWELHYLRPPAELAGHQPLWISTHFLKSAQCEGGLLRCGEAGFTSLYLDCEWLDNDGLGEILRLAEAGLHVCLKRLPSRPGRGGAGYGGMLRRLTSLPSVRMDWPCTTLRRPLVTGEGAPDFWARVVDDDLVLFFGHPRSRGLTYPLRYGQSFSGETVTRDVVLSWSGYEQPVRLEFAPYQSLLLRVSKSGRVRWDDIEYLPPTPLDTPYM